eukprot:1987944-Amphidinium_carterae.1
MFCFPEFRSFVVFPVTLLWVTVYDCWDRVHPPLRQLFAHFWWCVPVPMTGVPLSTLCHESLVVGGYHHNKTVSPSLHRIAAN